MNVWQQSQQQVLRDLKVALGKEYTPTVEELETPPDSAMGDISYPCFHLAKAFSRSPVEIASELAAKIGPKEWVREVKSVGPYVNFFLDLSPVGTAVLEQIAAEGERYGTSDVGKNKNVMIEYANLNTHKDVHVGHLRNLFVGQGLVNLLGASGYDVIPVYYINDLGAAVAACLYGIMEYGKGIKPKKEERVKFLGEMYAKGVNASEQDPDVKQMISQIQRDLEERKGPLVPLWEKTRLWSLDAKARTTAKRA